MITMICGWISSGRKQGHTQIVFWTQRDCRIKSGLVAGHGLGHETLEDGGENEFGLKLSEGHTNAGAWSPTKGKECTRWNRLAVRRVPALGTKDFRVAPDVRAAMQYPLAHQEASTSGEMV